MSINQLLEISRRSFQTYDAGLNTVAQNVANAETEGYHRRRINLASSSTEAPGVLMGPPGKAERMTGVSIESYERVRDRLFATSAREARTGMGAAEEESRILGGVESTFAVGSDGSLSNVLNDFWNAWSDVADNPTDAGAREALLGRAQTLTTTFNRINRDMEQLRSETKQVLSGGISTVNSTLERIGELNAQIQKARSAGSPNLTAEDERDQLVDKLAEFAPVQVQEDDATGYTVTMHGLTVVQGSDAQALELKTTSRTPPPNFPSETTEIQLKGTNVTFPTLTSDDGKLGAWTRTLNKTLPGVRNDLDALVNDIVTKVNTQHTAGYDLNGNPGGDFFDASSTTASTMKLDAAMTDPALIAAAAEDPANPGTSDGPGNGDQALAIFDERGPIEDEAIRIASDLGSQVEEANKRASAQSAALAQVESMAQGVSGVSLDEEMTKMIEYQQGFAASARVLRTAQSMMDTLLAM